MSATCPACGAGNPNETPWSNFRWADFSYAFVACRECGTWFADPMPGPDVVAQLYGPGYVDTHYAECASGDARQGEGQRELLEVVEEAMRRRPASKWLDVGCGAGDVLRAVASQGGRPEGFEPDAASAAATQRRTGHVVHHGSLDDLPRTYDVVHAADVLEHVADPVGLMHAIRDRVGRDGLLVLRGPLEAQPTLFRSLMLWRSALVYALGRSRGPTDAPPYHVVLFSLDGWNRLLERSGVSVIHQRVYESRWPAPARGGFSLVSLVKEMSMVVSRTKLGRALGLGSRVVTFAKVGKA